MLLKSVSEDDSCALYIAAVKRSLGPFQAATLEAAIASIGPAIEQDLLPYCGRPEQQILLDHTSLGGTWTLFYLQEKSSS